MVNGEEVDTERVKRQYEDDRHYEYHLKQFKTPLRSTVHLAEFVRETVNDLKTKYNIIDVGCGGGANIQHLAQVFPNSSWTGLDFADKFFEIGKKLLDKKIDCQFVKGDFFKLTELGVSFDIVFSMQTLSWLPSYETALEQLMGAATKWVFVSSLFTDFNVDAINTIYLYNGDKWDRTEPYNYNIYSVGRFEHFCRKFGAQDIIFKDFAIDIEIPKPASRTMSTYTVRSFDRDLMQFSGPLYLPWKFVAIRK